MNREFDQDGQEWIDGYRVEKKDQAELYLENRLEQGLITVSDRRAILDGKHGEQYSIDPSVLKGNDE